MARAWVSARVSAGVSALSLLLGACSTVHYPVNAPLAQVNTEQGYRAMRMIRHPGDEELLVILTFSGGGARAAALSYGVLEELAKQRIVWQGKSERLLDEVDLVTGVSGGAITAAYWGLKGDRIFTEFEPRFLERDFQSRLLNHLTSVSNLWRASSPRFGRGDLLAEELDLDLFEGATFGDLAKRSSGPFVVISATDLANGARFDFNQETFDLICSDLDGFPLARAVAASSAVPLIFSPITLWNHAGSCGPQGSARASVSAAEGRNLPAGRLAQRLRELSRYSDRTQAPYVHLVDGGVSDNLALRSLVDLDSYAWLNPTRAPVDQQFKRVRRIVIIAVDAGVENHSTIASNANVPTVWQVAQSLAAVVVERYSQETRLLVQETFARWRAQEISAGANPRDMPLHIIPVSFQMVSDPVQRKALEGIPTTLYLPPKQIRLLREVAGKLVRESPDFQRLMQDIGAHDGQGANTDGLTTDQRPAANLTQMQMQINTQAQIQAPVPPLTPLTPLTPLPSQPPQPPQAQASSPTAAP